LNLLDLSGFAMMGRFFCGALSNFVELGGLLATVGRRAMDGSRINMPFRHEKIETIHARNLPLPGPDVLASCAICAKLAALETTSYSPCNPISSRGKSD